MYEDDDVGSVEWEVVPSEDVGLAALREAYDGHDYAAVIRGCDAILAEHPADKSAKKLKWMAKKRLFNHDLRLGVAVLSVGMLAIVGSMSFMNKKVLSALRAKDVQVSSLVDEVGDLREENVVLYQKMEHNFQNLKEVKASLTDLETLLPEDADAVALQAKLHEAQTHLEAQSQAVEALVAERLGQERMLIGKDETLDVLILGTHGTLTDTMMLASVNPAKRTVSLFSIPRDLVVNGRRINEFYTRYGVELLRAQIEEITGLFPEKYVVVDLKAFEAIVDRLGGIDVNVEKPLYDASYPGPNGTVRVFSVDAGPQHFDGRTALMYGRSRKSTSDFDRAARQQQIIEAVQSRVHSLNLLENMGDLVALFSETLKFVDTDVDLLAGLSFAKKFHDYTIERGHVLTSGNFLYSTTGIQGAYLLLPRDATYGEIRAYVAEVVRK